MSVVSAQENGVGLLEDLVSNGYAPQENSFFRQEPFITDGRNLWGKNGALRKRPGFVIDSQVLATVEVIWIQESPLATLIASVYRPVNDAYELWYKKTSGSWAFVPALRGSNFSLDPHEGVWIGETFYARGVPVTDKLGTIIFDSVLETTAPWGLLPLATDPTLNGTSGSWGASDNTLDVKYGLFYLVTAESSTGHESSASAPTASTGIFATLRPEVSITPPTDTTEVPFLNIYRSHDGGGRFSFLERITNTGSPLTYTDENTATATNGNPNASLTVERGAPTATSNNPPPSTEAGVTGVDAVERSSPIAFSQSRIWFAVGRRLHFSVHDEAVPGSGKLLESFPNSATALDNSILFDEIVLDLIPTRRGLWVFTGKKTYLVTGFLRGDLLATKFYDYGVFDRRCVARSGSRPVWFDSKRTLRLGLENATTLALSGVIGDIWSGKDQYRAVEWTQNGEDYIVVTVSDFTTPSNSRLYVLRLLEASQNSAIWMTPWAVTAKRFGLVGRTLGAFDSTGQLAIATVGTFADFASGYDTSVTASHENVPAGDQINLRRVSAHNSVLDYVRVLSEGSAPTTVEVTTKSKATSYVTGVKSNPSALPVPDDYTRGYYYIQDISEVSSVRVTSPVDTSDFVLNVLDLNFQPGLGD